LGDVGVLLGKENKRSRKKNSERRGGTEKPVNHDNYSTSALVRNIGSCEWPRTEKYDVLRKEEEVVPPAWGSQVRTTFGG